MARIELDDVSLTFTVRKGERIRFKDYVLRGLFLRGGPPQMAVRALSNISFAAGDGERVGVIGHNGAGKSTLLKMLAGIYPPTAGTRTVDGRVCSLFDISLGFEAEETGWDNIRYRAYLQGETPKTLAKKIDAIADFSELGEFLDLPIRYYSGGMLIRLAFSIATSMDPEVLLVDEILAVGDMAFQIKARARMMEMMRQARLMVMVSHDLSCLPVLCDRVLWMQHGEVVMDGPTDAVIAAYKASMLATAAAAADPTHIGGVTGAAA